MATEGGLDAEKERTRYDHIRLTTTAHIPGHIIEESLGLVHARAVLGIHMFKDLAAGLRDIFGGRIASYENELKAAADQVVRELRASADALGANAIVGIRLDHDSVSGTVLMITAQGTAVKISPLK
ncbi:MAG: YbjQ family protein [candidate division NC10 bacterium]|nr:YbjQ family protein [candidate division NC10 bacterium]